jgi:hypothetical protein
MDESPTGAPMARPELSVPAPAPARRRVSRWLMVGLVVSALAVGGGELFLRSAAHDRRTATAQAARAQGAVDDQQAAGAVEHDDLSRSTLAGRALDAGMARPLDTIQQLNALDKTAAGLLATMLQSGEAGASGIGAWNGAVAAGNAEVAQGNALYTQLQDETKDLDTD